MHIVNQFQTEAKTKAFIRKYIFNSGRTMCPKCRVKRRFSVLRDGRYWCSYCRTKWSLRQLGGISGSKLSYQQIANLLYCFLNNHTLQSAMDFVNVSYPTVRRYYTLYRGKASVLQKEYSRNHLSGTVAIDACYVGKQRNNNQAIVLGVVQSDYKDIALRIVPEEEQGYVEKFLFDTTKKGSHIIHDGHRAYTDLTWCGYTHQTEYHNLHQFTLTSSIERIWALLKTFIRRRYHHVTKEKLSEYLAEFQFKFLHKETHKTPRQFAQFLFTAVPTA